MLLQVLNRLRIIAERAAASPQKLSTMFQTYDQDGSGEIAYDEFDIMVKEMGCMVKGANSAEELLERFDKQGLLLRAAAPGSLEAAVRLWLTVVHRLYHQCDEVASRCTA